MKWAIDSDDVLLELNKHLQEFKVERDRSKGILETNVLKLEEIYDYNLGRVWGCSLDEAFEIIEEFFESEYYDGMAPVPGGLRATKRLRERGDDLVVLTSRVNSLQQRTIEQFDIHYSGIFNDILFSSEWSNNSGGITKGEICDDIGAERLVDDRFKYCNGASGLVEKSYLFDLEGKYGWNKKNGLILPRDVERVLSWETIMEKEGLS